MEKYLIVSLGSIGRRHLKNLRAMKPDACIGALRLQAGEAERALPEGLDYQFSSLEDALSFAPTAAIIASPASTHLRIAEALVGAGIHTLIEKPVADRSERLDDLLRLAEARKVRLMVGYNLRFLPSLQKVRTLLREGAIGKVCLVRAEVGQYLPDWRPERPYQETVSAQRALGGGALLELSHEIDYITWLFGMPSTISARGGRFGKLEIDVEDAAELTLEYESPDRLVNIHLDLLQRAPTRTVKFVGERGTMIWDGIEDSVTVFDAGTRQWSHVHPPAQGDRNQMYVDELLCFLDPDAAATSIASDGAQGRDVLKLVEAAKASMESNRTLRMSDDEKR